MLPGKIIEFVNTIGIIIIVETIWQNGISQESKFSLEKVIVPLILIRFTMNTSAKNKAMAINPIALYLSVLPVNTIRKNRVLKKKKVARNEMSSGVLEKLGLPPVIKTKLSKSIGRVSKMLNPILPVLE
jgi:hypothetical protein